MNTNTHDNHEIINNTILSACAEEDQGDIRRLVGETVDTVVVPSGTGRVDSHHNEDDDVLAMMMLMDGEGMMLDCGGLGFMAGEGHSCGDALMMYMTSPAFSKAVQEHRGGARETRDMIRRRTRMMMEGLGAEDIAKAKKQMREMLQSCTPPGSVSTAKHSNSNVISPAGGGGGGGPSSSSIDTTLLGKRPHGVICLGHDVGVMDTLTSPCILDAYHRPSTATSEFNETMAAFGFPGFDDLQAPVGLMDAPLGEMMSHAQEAAVASCQMKRESLYDDIDQGLFDPFLMMDPTYGM